MTNAAGETDVIVGTVAYQCHNKSTLDLTESDGVNSRLKRHNKRLN